MLLKISWTWLLPFETYLCRTASAIVFVIDKEFYNISSSLSRIRLTPRHADRHPVRNNYALQTICLVPKWLLEFWPRQTLIKNINPQRFIKTWQAQMFIHIPNAIYLKKSSPENNTKYNHTLSFVNSPNDTRPLFFPQDDYSAPIFFLINLPRNHQTIHQKTSALTNAQTRI